MWVCVCHVLNLWGVEPGVHHQTDWLGSTGECDVQQSQADRSRGLAVGNLNNRS